MIRVVVDTNVTISAFLWGGTPEKVFDFAGEGRVTLITSNELTNELENTLSKHKPQKYIFLTGKTSGELVDRFIRITRLTEPAPIPDNVVRDPKDIMVLAAGVGGHADYIVTGDKDLLSLNSYAGIEILNVSDFLAIMDTEA